MTPGSLPEFALIRHVLGRSPHTCTLPGAFLDRLARLGHVERYRGGELVHAAWQPLRRFCFLLSGGLRVSLLGEDGTALTIAVLGEGSCYGAGSLMKDGAIERSEAHAIGDTLAAGFELAQLQREFAGDKLARQHRMALLHRLLIVSVDIARDLLTVPLAQRLARRLLSQALAAGRGPEVELLVSQADLADMLGASRAKVNAELRRLEDGAAVGLGYRRIVVRDLHLLRAAAGADVMPQ